MTSILKLEGVQAHDQANERAGSKTAQRNYVENRGDTCAFSLFWIGDNS